MWLFLIKINLAIQKIKKAASFLIELPLPSTLALICARPTHHHTSSAVVDSHLLADETL
jgi:hypothetical protein